METKVISIDENSGEEIAFGAKLLREGQLVSFPTETVYGLGADGLNEEAVRKIYQAKGRPSDNPLILHISELEELKSLVLEIPEAARLCMQRFWPGPLTIIFKRSKIIPDLITGGLETVAIRMPDHPIARRLIKEAASPIAAPSANTSGRPSPTRAQHVYEDLRGKIPLILDGGATGIGLESTVLDLSEEIPSILRPGGITLEQIREILPETVLDRSIVELDKNIIPKSPGQKYKHYAPRADMYLFKGSQEALLKEINKRAADFMEKGLKVGVMATDSSKDSYRADLVYSMGSREDESSIAHNLFSILRTMDAKKVDVILAESVEFSHIGIAIMNRMLKAASGQLIEL